MKTNFLRLLILVFAGTLILESCRKGENDPLISLRTRDARITGKWELVDFEATSSEINNTGVVNTNEQTTTTYDGSTWTNTSNGNTDSYTYTREITIEDDGNYIYRETIEGEISEETGTWSWLDNTKKKIGIFLDQHGLFHIDQLKNEEMVWLYDYSDQYTNNDGETDSQSYSSRAVYEKQ
ncbi:MAG: hypothetical protein R3277_10465 [Brumimicrobium sp.]|nr:hypothetical protein [Brumimicrobium sp.]